MRNYFLLEAGDTMYDFYTSIFEKAQEKECWQQLSFLNVQLQEAVGQRHPEDSSRYCGSLFIREGEAGLDILYSSHSRLFTENRAGKRLYEKLTNILNKEVSTL